MLDKQLCDDCIRGYYAPFDRFRRVVNHPHGPEFLSVCSKCGALWDETLHGARRVTEVEAQSRFPEFKPGRQHFDADGKIFAAFGIAVFRRLGRRFFLRYDPGEPFAELREAEITESEALTAQKSQQDAYEVVAACKRRLNSHPSGFREAPLTVIRIDGTRSVIHMGKLVTVANGSSRLRPGWSGTLTFSEETNSFVELSSAPGNSTDWEERAALEVDDSYALRAYQVTRLDIPK